MDFGALVRSARKERALTQETLAKQAGVSRQALIALEQSSGRVDALLRVQAILAFRLAGLPASPRLTDQLRLGRDRLGLTQQAVAQAAGISIPTLRLLERGAGSVRSLSQVVAALAPEARKSRVAKVHWSTAGDDRFTPPGVLAAVADAWGPISIDPCADERSFVVADRYIYRSQDGLRTSWSGRLAFCNPPYSDHSKWIRRCYDAIKNREVEVVVAFLAARIETVAFHQNVLGKADLLIPRGKPRFHDTTGKQMSIAPFASIFAVWNSNSDPVRRFANEIEAPIIWANGVEKPAV